MLDDNPLMAELWQEDVTVVPVATGASVSEAARRLDILLDLLLLEASSASAHLLDESFEGVLTDDERRLRDLLLQFKAAVPQEVRSAPAWDAVARLLSALGDETP